MVSWDWRVAAEGFSPCTSVWWTPVALGTVIAWPPSRAVGTEQPMAASVTRVKTVKRVAGLQRGSANFERPTSNLQLGTGVTRVKGRNEVLKVEGFFMSSGFVFSRYVRGREGVYGIN